MIRLLCDQDSLDLVVVRMLIQRGFDVTRSVDLGLARASDDELLAFATSHARAIYTANVSDYVALHWKYVTDERPHGGVIVRTRQSLSPSLQVTALVAIGQQYAAEQLQSGLFYLENFL